MMQKRSSIPDPNIAVIGGGTGGFTLLQALKLWTPNITAIVSMADDGGSTGALRDEFGVLPPGDVRKSLIALSRSPEVLRNLFNYRLEGEMFGGHAFGNLFLTALEKVTGNFAEAVETASTVLNIIGKVVPITLDDVRLTMKIGDDRVMRGEGVIDAARIAENGRRPELLLEPKASINPDAHSAILAADLVIISAGDLYTSLGASLIVEGVAEALMQTEARIVYICNLVTKPGHTDGLTVAGHAAEIERFVGSPVLDYVLYNTERPVAKVLGRYTTEGEMLVDADQAELASAHYRSIGRSLISREKVQIVTNDPLAAQRSLIRHNARAVVRLLKQLLEG
jgi:uncharacterized cofD-like protein